MRLDARPAQVLPCVDVGLSASSASARVRVKARWVKGTDEWERWARAVVDCGERDFGLLGIINLSSS